jgi:hypothetical protein
VQVSNFTGESLLFNKTSSLHKGNYYTDACIHNGWKILQQIWEEAYGVSCEEQTEFLFIYIFI